MPHLSPGAQKFILHWGEMGTRWGINRTVAQIHALLYLSPRPLHAEEIADTLAVARSNVSTSLRELQSWGIVRVLHVLGDRRAHYVSMKDVWEMFQVILEERKKREVDPTLEILRGCLAELGKPGGDESYARERLEAMLDLFETATAAYDELRPLPTGTLRNLVRMRGKVRKLLGKRPGK